MLRRSEFQFHLPVGMWSFYQFIRFEETLQFLFAGLRFFGNLFGDALLVGFITFDLEVAAADANGTGLTFSECSLLFGAGNVGFHLADLRLLIEVGLHLVLAFHFFMLDIVAISAGILLESVSE